MSEARFGWKRALAEEEDRDGCGCGRGKPNAIRPDPRRHLTASILDSILFPINQLLGLYIVWNKRATCKITNGSCPAPLAAFQGGLTMTYIDDTVSSLAGMSCIYPTPRHCRIKHLACITVDCATDGHSPWRKAYLSEHLRAQLI